MKQTMTGMAGMGMKDRLKMAQQMQAQAMQNPGGMMGKTKKGTGKRLSTKEKLKLKKEREREMRRKKRGDGK
jgi:signal recognition particle subunit SRP54